MSRKIILIIISIFVFTVVSAKVVFALGTGLGDIFPDVYDPRERDRPDEIFFCSCGEAINFSWDKIPLDKLCRSSSASVPYLNTVTSRWEWSCDCPGFASIDGRLVEPSRKISCSAPYVQGLENGKCGSSNGISTSAKSSTNLCSVGVPEWLPDFADKWNWKCKGRNGGTDALCSATVEKTPDLKDGICNPAYHGKKHSSLSPGKYLCIQFGFFNFSASSFGWTWTCKGENGGKDASCWANKKTVINPPSGKDFPNKNTKEAEYKARTPYSIKGDVNKLTKPNVATTSVFLISDDDWKDILSLVPVAVWSEPDARIYKNPLLIYWNEGDNFDPDSPIHFMQQYRANHLYYANYNASDKGDQAMDVLIQEKPDKGAGISDIETPLTSDYFAFWSNIDTVVFSENKYETSLLASAYASLINAPLIIDGGKLDDPLYYNGKVVVCAGNTPTEVPCNLKFENYAKLDARYSEIIKTLDGQVDKLIVVNPADLDKEIVIQNSNFLPFQTYRTQSEIDKIYGKHSLSAPYLAAAKHELILPIVKNMDYTSRETLVCFEANSDTDKCLDIRLQVAQKMRDTFAEKLLPAKSSNRNYPQKLIQFDETSESFRTDITKESRAGISTTHEYNGKYYYIKDHALISYNPTSRKEEVVLGLDLQNYTSLYSIISGVHQDGRMYINKDVILYLIDLKTNKLIRKVNINPNEMLTNFNGFVGDYFVFVSISNKKRYLMSLDLRSNSQPQSIIELDSIADLRVKYFSDKVLFNYEDKIYSWNQAGLKILQDENYDISDFDANGSLLVWKSGVDKTSYRYQSGQVKTISLADMGSKSGSVYGIFARGNNFFVVGKGGTPGIAQFDASSDRPIKFTESSIAEDSRRIFPSINGLDTSHLYSYYDHINYETDYEPYRFMNRTSGPVRVFDLEKMGESAEYDPTILFYLPSFSYEAPVMHEYQDGQNYYTDAYLTVLGDSYAIPYWDNNFRFSGNNASVNRYYWSFDKSLASPNMEYLQIPFGRLTAFNLSDLSSNIARNTFYDLTYQKGKVALFSALTGGKGDGNRFVDSASESFKDSGFTISAAFTHSGDGYLERLLNCREYCVCTSVYWKGIANNYKDGKGNYPYKCGQANFKCSDHQTCSAEIKALLKDAEGKTDLEGAQWIVAEPLLIEEAELWRGSEYVYYNDHGNPNFSGVYEGSIRPASLGNAIVIGSACSSAEVYDILYSRPQIPIAMRAIREGAISFMGNVTMSYSGETNDTLIFSNALYYDNMAQGEAMVVGTLLHRNNTLIGDPTLKVKTRVKTPLY